MLVEVLKVAPIFREVAQTCFEGKLPPINPNLEVSSETEIDILDRLLVS